MSDSQLQAAQPQTVAQANAQDYATIHGLISNYGNNFMAIVTYLACVLAFPILTFLLTLHDVYEGDFDKARFAAFQMAALVTAVYGIGFFMNRKSKKLDVTDQGKKDQ